MTQHGQDEEMITDADPCTLPLAQLGAYKSAIEAYDQAVALNVRSEKETGDQRYMTAATMISHNDDDDANALMKDTRASPCEQGTVQDEAPQEFRRHPSRF